MVHVILVLDICINITPTGSAAWEWTLDMAAASVRFICRCGNAELISHLSTKSCYCRPLATRAVRFRSQSCIPRWTQSPTLSATLQFSDCERWLSTTGPNMGQSKSSQKNWIQYLSRFYPTVDVSSMSRALTSLHLDIPRNLPEIRRLFPNISFAQMQQIFLSANRFRRDKVSSGSDKNSSLGDKQLTDAVGVHNTEHSSYAEVKRTPVQNAAELQCEEKRESENVIGTPDKNEETKSCPASVQQHIVADSVDTSHTQVTTSSAAVTDGVISKVNTVASGIARQIAEYMPAVDVNTTTQTKPRQQRESREVDSKMKTKPSEMNKEDSAVQKQMTVRRQLVTRGSIDRQTRGLVLCLRDARTSTSQLVRLEELCQHIAQYPDCTGIAVKVCLLLTRLMGQYCFARCHLSALSVVVCSACGRLAAAAPGAWPV